MTTPQSLYEFRVEGFSPDHFRVRSFTGRETLSQPYSFHIVATCADEADKDLERLALGQRAVLTWHVGKAPRAFHGVVAAVRLEDVRDAQGHVKLTMRLVPRLWLLKRKKNTRIFQNMRVSDIVSANLNDMADSYEDPEQMLRQAVREIHRIPIALAGSAREAADLQISCAQPAAVLD